MNIDRIIGDLRAERAQIDQAIAALEKVGFRGNRKTSQYAKNPKRKLTLAARRRIGAAMKKHWAQRKKKAA